MSKGPNRQLLWSVAAMLALLSAVGPGIAEMPALADQDIADAIEDQYLVDQTVDVNRIDIAVTEGIVELTGQVDSLLVKERAGRIAGRVKGVRAVSNRILVVPSVVLTDAGIEEEVEGTLMADPAADAYDVDVTVEDNVVTLSGEVESWAEMDLAIKVAKSVRGVIAVNNDLDIRIPDQRRDSEIRDEIAQRLRWSVLVEDGLIDVAVAEGQVMLSGTVGSLEEKRLAESLARVTGVTSVDASGLEIKWWAQDEALRDNKYAARSDEEIEQAIKDVALYDPRIASFQIHPEILGGWVTLRGVVDNLAVKKAAGRVARNTVGVKGVTNRLKVRPDVDNLTEEVVEADIRGRLIVNPVTGEGIEVEVENGRAILFGTLGSRLERLEAERLAGMVSGVTRVSNQLRVSEDSGAADRPFAVDDYPTMTATVERMTPARTDQEIHDEIHDEMFWSPFVDAGQIDIDVRNGRATLEGSVDTWREYHAAEENAYEGGALFVINRLKVE